jgi:hypothetical protein
MNRDNDSQAAMPEGAATKIISIAEHLPKERRRQRRASRGNGAFGRARQRVRHRSETRRRLCEFVPSDDVLAAGVLVEDVGSHGGRLVFYADQTCYEDAAAVSAVQVVKCKIVLSSDALHDVTIAILDFLYPVRGR